MNILKIKYYTLFWGGYISKRGLIYGWGVVDVNYKTQLFEIVNGKRVCLWICPYYEKWRGVLKRCLSKKEKLRYPTYQECTVTDEWMYLSNFIKWVDSQPNRDWQSCHLDKDLLFTGNKYYSPDTAVFINYKVNAFLLDNGRNRGDCLIGVNWKERQQKFQARCNNPFTLQSTYLGLFSTELEAHLAWKDKKREYACMMAEMQTDLRVANALRCRYE